MTELKKNEEAQGTEKSEGKLIEGEKKKKLCGTNGNQEETNSR